MPFDTTKQGGGVLFQNDRKEKETQPDYTGNLELTPEFIEELKRHAQSGATKFPLSAWIKKGRRGSFMSLSLQAPWNKEPANSPRNASRRDPLDSDIPF